MEFKPIKGYEGIYEACSDGTIWTCEGKTTYSNRHGRIIKRVWKRREIKPQIQRRVRSNHSDKHVKLWKDKKMKTHRVCLKDLSNNTEHRFNSMSEASEFLDRSHGYVSMKIKSGKKIKGYELTIL